MIKRLLTIALLSAAISKSYSQTHIYQFTGSLSGTGPVLTEVSAPACGASPSGDPGHFDTRVLQVSAAPGGVPQQVFQFNANAGLSYTNNTGSGGLGITGTYTIHIFYAIHDYTEGAYFYQRLIDFSNGTLDNGLHTTSNAFASDPTPTIVNVHGETLAPNPPTATNITLPSALVAGRYYLVSLVRNGAGLLDVYLNGSAILTGYNDAGGDYASNGTDPIIFFRDEVTSPYGFTCESDSGAVRYLSVSNSTSTALQVNNIWQTLSATVLPISLTDFTAQKNTNSIIVQWQTASEANAAYYSVERSNDGQNFTGIATVNAKNATSNSYSYNDLSGISLTSNYTYYRLKSVDVNGNFKYSAIVKVANGKETKITLFPNPTTNFVTISGLNNKDQIRVLSIDGKVLSQQTANAQSMIMSVEKYKAGTYIIQVKNDTQVSQEKFVKY